MLWHFLIKRAPNQLLADSGVVAAGQHVWAPSALLSIANTRQAAASYVWTLASLGACSATRDDLATSALAASLASDVGCPRLEPDLTARSERIMDSKILKEHKEWVNIAVWGWVTSAISFHLFWGGETSICHPPLSVVFRDIHLLPLAR